MVPTFDELKFDQHGVEDVELKGSAQQQHSTGCVSCCACATQAAMQSVSFVRMPLVVILGKNLEEKN